MSVRKHFKKWFVPHRHNKYHPHIFRNATIVIVFSLCLFLLGVSYGNSIYLRQTVMGANIATNVLVDLANKSRVENNVVPLKRNNKLDLAAGLKANDMITNRYFAHFSPDGTTPWYFMGQAGYNFIYAGENLAINFLDSTDVNNAWMNSPTHKENLMNSNFKDIGMGTKEGFYQGASTIYIVQMFGSEAKPKPEYIIKEKVIEEPVSTVEDSRMTATPSPIKVIVESKNFISVKNTDNVEEEGKVAGIETYSTWYDRLIFNSPYYIQIFFLILILIVSGALIVRIFVEYKRQHYKHLVISIVFLLTIIAIATLNLSYVNIF